MVKKTLNIMFNSLISKETRIEVSLLRKHYSLVRCHKGASYPCVVFSLDSRFESNGLADRLRGIVSLYAYCKARGFVFRIDHQAPFHLADYLSPSNYDWRIKDEEIEHNLLRSRPIYFMDKSNPERIFKIRKGKKIQYHVYTNIDCIELINQAFDKNYTFSELFNELFKPAPSLEYILKDNLAAIGKEYISISFRFMQLLGEKDVRGDVLNNSGKAKLIHRSMECVKSIQKQNANLGCLVTADSNLFLQEVTSLTGIYVAPGKVGHIGHNDEGDVFLKTFLDFFLVANAKQVYLASSGSMYSQSLFAKTAALVNNHPFKRISY